MGGDHAGGLALAILVAMVLFLLGAVALFVLVGRALTRNLAPRRRFLVVGLMTLAGVGAGWLLVMAIFYEGSWTPPPRLHRAVAPGFDGPAVILLEDPGAATAVEWRGGGLPFTAATAEVVVPPSGIVRVRSFGLMEGRADLDVIWSDRLQGFGAGGGPGPPGTGASAYMIFERPDLPWDGASQFSDPAAIAAYVRERERPRRQAR